MLKIISWVLHQRNEDRECNVLVHTNAHQDKCRQIIHALCVANIFAVLAISEQHLVERIQIQIFLFESFELSESTVHILHDLLSALLTLSVNRA